MQLCCLQQHAWFRKRRNRGYGSGTGDLRRCAQLGGAHRQDSVLVLLILRLLLVLVTLMIMLGGLLILGLRVRVLLENSTQARTRNQRQTEQTACSWANSAHATAASVI